MTDSETIQELFNRACEVGDIDEVKSLVSRGADVKACNDWALGLAAIGGHLDLIKYLVNNGAKPRACDDEGLRLASEKGHLDVVKYFIKHGADVKVHEDEPLGLAIRRGHLPVVKYLVEEQGADINGETAKWGLEHAKSEGHHEVISYFDQ